MTKLELLLNRLNITPPWQQANVPHYQTYHERPESTDGHDVLAYVRQVLDRYGLSLWEARIDNAKRRLGICKFRPKVIGLSRHLLDLGDVEAVRNTVLHEVAHALAGSLAGHGPVWRRVAQQLGCDGERTSCVNTGVKGRWQGTCGGCGQVSHRHRKPKQLEGWHCRKCGRYKGKIVWADTQGA